MRPPAGPVGGLGGDREGSLRILISVLLVLLVALQYRLWFTDGGLLEVRRLHAAIAEQRERNAALRARNEALAAEVSDLKQGLDAIEARGPPRRSVPSCPPRARPRAWARDDPSPSACWPAAPSSNGPWRPCWPDPSLRA
ncbi:MAG: cell division protein FtsB [Proteobacteria bacterium SW_6_67_9]|nr:MAG: cell division protein FtsB [Proteobacteria bacterium SW_6_67_9]